MPFHHRVDTEADHGQAIAVYEQALIPAALPGAEPQLLHCFRPQRTYPALVAFAEDADGPGMPIDIGDSDRACLGGAGAGVVEEQQQGVVPFSLRRGPIGCRQDRVHLWLVEIGDADLNRLLDRNQPDLCTPLDMLGTAFADEASQGMDAGQTLIARCHGTVAGVFQIGKKRSNQVGC